MYFALPIIILNDASDQIHCPSDCQTPDAFSTSAGYNAWKMRRFACSSIHLEICCHVGNKEEYHSCLKTGCALEKSQLRQGQRLQRLLGLLAVVAVRLLQLRDLARTKPHWLALQVIDPLLVQMMAVQASCDPNTMTVHQFWYAVARLGGFPGRAADGQPGWKRLWHG